MEEDQKKSNSTVTKSQPKNISEKNDSRPKLNMGIQKPTSENLRVEYKKPDFKPKKTPENNKEKPASPNSSSNNDDNIFIKVSEGMKAVHDLVVAFGPTEEERKEIHAFELAKKYVDNEYKKTGIYLNREDTKLLDDLLLNNGIKVTNSVRLTLQKEVAAHLLMNPNSLKEISQFKTRSKNKDVINNLSDLAYSIERNDNRDFLNDAYVSGTETNKYVEGSSFIKRVWLKAYVMPACNLRLSIRSSLFDDTEENLKRRETEWDERVKKEQKEQEELSKKNKEEQSMSFDSTPERENSNRDENVYMTDLEIVCNRMTEISDLSRIRRITEEEKKIIYKKIDDEYEKYGTYISNHHQEILDDIITTNKIKLDPNKKKAIERDLAYQLIYIPEIKALVDKNDRDFHAFDYIFHVDDMSENIDVINDSFDVFRSAYLRFDRFKEARVKEICEKAKIEAEEDYKKRGAYISQKHSEILEKALSSAKIKLDENQKKRIKKQLALNFLINPHYKIIFETCDLTVTKENNTPNKSVIKNVDDMFKSILQRFPEKIDLHFKQKHERIRIEKDFIHEINNDPYCPILLSMSKEENARAYVIYSMYEKNEKRIFEREKKERLEREQKEKEQEKLISKLTEKAQNRFAILLHHISPEIKESINNKMIKSTNSSNFISKEELKESSEKLCTNDGNGYILSSSTKVQDLYKN